MTRRLVLAGLLVGLLVASAFGIHRAARPPLRLLRMGDAFVIDVQTLGEYPTTIERIQLTRGHDVVWEVEARAPPRTMQHQLWAFGLKVGTNSTRLTSCRGSGAAVSCDLWEHPDGFVPVRPASSTFVLEAGGAYRLSVWGSDHWWARASTTLLP